MSRVVLRTLQTEKHAVPQTVQIQRLAVQGTGQEGGNRPNFVVLGGGGEVMEVAAGRTDGEVAGEAEAVGRVVSAEAAGLCVVCSVASDCVH